MSADNNNQTTSPEEIGFQEVQSRRVQFRETGVDATVRDTDHARTNHYIMMSKPYFKDKALRPFIDCCNVLQIARSLCFASLFGFLGAFGLPGIPIILAVGCVLFFLVYCQHEWVNLKSLPVVLKQPVFESQRHPNQFYELTVTELKGVALKNYRAGVGFVQLTQGKIQFQAFNKTAVEQMSRAKCQSRWMLFLFFLMSAYNICLVFVAFSKY